NPDQKGPGSNSVWRHSMIVRAVTLVLLCAGLAVAADDSYDYRVLATSRTATMEKELNQGADAGYRMEKAMGGGTAFGGQEVVVVMSKSKIEGSERGRYAYKLLATNRTSTMQKELQEAGNEGFD